MGETPAPERFTLGPSQAAELLGVHEGTVRAWADAGVLSCFRTPGGHRRFRRSDIDAFLARSQQPAKAAS